MMQLAFVTLLVTPHHSATLATGATLYENAHNDAHRTIVKTFKY